MNAMPDIPRIYTAFAEWLACMAVILPLKKRFDKTNTAAMAAAVFLLQAVFLTLTGNVAIYFWIPCMIAAVLIMIGFIFCECDIALMDAGYFGVLAFVGAELMASLQWQVACFIDNSCSASDVKSIITLIIIYGGFFTVFYRILKKHIPSDARMEITVHEYLSAVLIGIAVFAVSNLSFITADTPFSSRYSFEIGNIRTLVDIGGIAILYAHMIQCCELRVRRELEAVQSVLQIMIFIIY